MKLKITVCIIVLVFFSGCMFFNPEKKYTPENAAGYYFPPISEELKQKQAECLRLKNYPCLFLPQNDTLNDFENEWYSTHLASMKEPILYNQIGQGKKVVRFTHLGTWTKPYSYRIENINGRITGTYNKTLGRGGYSAGPRIKHQVRELNMTDWNVMVSRIDSTFWNIQTHDTNMVFDGDKWILEVLMDDKYHVVERNCPEHFDEKFCADLCKQVMATFNGK